MSLNLESKDGVIFETDAPVMFSPMEKKLGLTFQWKAWKSRVVSINRDGQVLYRNNKNDTFIQGTFILNKVIIEEMANRVESEEEDSEGGIVVNCQTLDDFDSSFRCIMNESELSLFKEAIRMVAKEHNIDECLRNSITDQVKRISKKPQPLWKRRNFSGMSIMRRAIATAMDKHDKRSIQERIIAKRGTMKYLPVLFSNDLVHGSWWFVIGSVLFVLTSIVILANSYKNMMGTDDSVLDATLYRWSFVLMTICGIFCTLGSMAFMRAVHEDPPMKPLFPSWHHLQNDELLGSWLLLLSVVPVVPYALLYLSTSESNYEYIGALVISLLLVAGCGLFVYCCYPSDQPRVKVIQPLAYTLCCCFCSRDWMRFHFNNDWLAATWLMYWGTAVATLLCFGLFLRAIAVNDSLQFFIYGTGLLESVLFLIGAAYFVAGSYPDGLSNADLDSVHSIHPSNSTTTTTNAVDTTSTTAIVQVMNGNGSNKSQNSSAFDVEHGSVQTPLHGESRV